jgi:hypothetical protein
MRERSFTSWWHLGAVRLGIRASSGMRLVYQLSAICCYVQDVGACLKWGKWLEEGEVR